MENPFIKIDSRLENIEVLLLDLKRHATQQPRQPDDEPGEASQTYVSKRQAARLLDCCTSTIDNHARAGHLTRHYVGKSVRFDRQQVLALAKRNQPHKQHFSHGK
jgi:excisionase family DNA binding protein